MPHLASMRRKRTHLSTSARHVTRLLASFLARGAALDTCSSTMSVLLVAAVHVLLPAAAAAAAAVPLELALALVPALAATGPPAAGAAPRWDGPCKSDRDCSLNGVCAASSGTCTCDLGYAGRRCEGFDFLPTPAGSAFHSPDTENTTSSWGGTSVYDPASKRWHGFFSEFVGSCGVRSWQTNSQIVRAVADSPFGPFTRQGVAIAAFAHNAEARRDPRSGEWLLLHIGAGRKGGNSIPGIECTAGNGTTSPRSRRNFTFPTGNTSAPLCPCCGVMGKCDCCSGPAMHHAPGPYGPWVAVNTSLANLPGRCHDNPTLYISPNGTAWVLGVCDSTPTPPSPTSVLMLWRAESWDGEFVIIGNVTRSNNPNDTSEKQWSWVDPTLWVDKRGNIHVVANMGFKDYGCRPLGGHAFSDDGGRTFHSFSTGANFSAIHGIYNGSTEFADGGGRRWLHYERPKIILDPESGAPIALFASVGSHGGDPSIAASGGPCRPLTNDRSWTIARPIRRARGASFAQQHA